MILAGGSIQVERKSLAIDRYKSVMIAGPVALIKLDQKLILNFVHLTRISTY